jgi:GNAT superfamily N-acetyltransferase
MPNEVRYRELTIAELPIAQDLRAAMIRELSGTDPDTKHPTWRRRYLDFYKTRAVEGRAAVFLAEIDETPVGVTAVYLLANHRSEIFGFQSAYVSNVWVDPQHRRKGIASNLMGMAVTWAKEKGCEVVRLRTSDMGRPVYASLGFVTTDEMELRLSR